MNFVHRGGRARFVFSLCAVAAAVLDCGGSARAQSAPSPPPATPSPGSPANPPTAPSSSSARRFDDWEIVCAPAQKADSCKAVQRLAAPGDNGSSRIVFAASVVRAAKDGQMVMVLSAPLGGYLTPGMAMKVDGRPLAKLLFETCETGGCHGGFVLTHGFRRTLERGKTLQVRLWTAKAKSADVSISLKGFGPALAALQVGK